MKRAHQISAWMQPRLLVAWFLSVSWGMAQQPANQTGQPAFATPAKEEAKKQVSAVPALAGVIVGKAPTTRDKQFESLDIYWWKAVKQPQAVLVLADEKARTEVFMNEAWVSFLKKHQWSLLVLGVKGAGTSPSLEPAVAALDQHLFTWIESKTRSPVNVSDDDDEEELEKKKGPIPLLFHASGSAAF